MCAAIVLCTRCNNGVATIVKTLGRLKNRQMRDKTNECLSVSVKKTNKDEQKLKHSCYSEGTITARVEAVKQIRTLVADKPPAKRKSKIMNVKEWKSLLKFLDMEMTTFCSCES